jgi:hypothetical protein
LGDGAARRRYPDRQTVKRWAQKWNIHRRKEKVRASPLCTLPAV